MASSFSGRPSWLATSSKRRIAASEISAKRAGMGASSIYRHVSTKHELLILWTDFFKPQHLEANPDLHDTFWKAAKLCSACKVEVNLEHAQELMDACKKIHEMFWKVKGREVAWYTAS